MNVSILYATHALNGILMIALPIGLGFYLVRKLHLSWNLFWIGGAVFVFSQILHIPFNVVVSLLFQRGILPSPSPEWALPFNAVFLGLSAGIFEETARYLMYRYWTKEARWWGQGVLLGAGHAGVEAMIVGGLVLFSYIQLVAYRGAGYAGLSPTEAAAVQQYWTIPWYTSLLGALERLLTLSAHIALSVMVLQVFVRRQLFWLGLAIAWHAVIDGLAAVWITHIYGIYAGEAALAGFAVLNLVIIFALRQPPPLPPKEPELTPLPAQAFVPVAFEVTGESLEETKYQ